jgi:hypothetical protein
MFTTFTIQSVHGLKETFVLTPHGTVNTTEARADERTEEAEPKVGSQTPDQKRR